MAGPQARVQRRIAVGTVDFRAASWEALGLGDDLQLMRWQERIDMRRSTFSAWLLGACSVLFVLGPGPPADADVITWKATGKGGAVAAGRMNSVAAGLQILSEGGNAADAAAATLLALAITDYGSFAIGGEVPLLIYDAKPKILRTYDKIYFTINRRE